MSRPLTPKQQRFVTEYLVDRDATEAAVRSGYSAGTARERGARLLVNASVASAVKLALEEQTARTALDVLKDIQDVTRAVRDLGDHRTTLKGLEMEGKHLGMFTDRVEHGGAVELVVVLPEAPK